MNIQSSPVGIPSRIPPSSSKTSAWESIKNAFGRVFSVIIYLPMLLINLVMRIKHLANERLFGSHSSSPLRELSNPVSIEPIAPELRDLFKQTLDKEPKEPANRQSQRATPHIVKSDDEKVIEDEGRKGNEEPKEPKSLPPTSVVKEEVPVKPQVTESPQSTPISPVVKRQAISVLPSIMDVPDDGNCLFYAIGVGLQKKYGDQPKIQEKLQWKVKSEELIGDLSKAANLLEAPGKKLREQAAKYLKAHQFEEEIMLALMEGVGSHLEVVSQKIEEEEAIIPILLSDIKTLKDQPQTANVQKQLQEKQAHLDIVQKSIQYQKDNLPSEDDLAGYIEATAKDHIYCGVAQLVALSNEYNIPIRVLYNCGKQNPYEQTFNEKLAKQDHPMPILTIAHVNGNHFKFVDD